MTLARAPQWLAALGVGLFAATSTVGGAGTARAQAGITITSAPAPSVVFGDVIAFEVEATSSGGDLTAASLHLQAGTQAAFAWPAVDFEPGAEVTARAVVDAAAAALPPFSQVRYWWELAASDGATLTSEPATFYYEDDRFEWRRAESGNLNVHWYAGEADFGQAALATAIAAYSEANRDIRAPLPERLELYIYANERDVRAALQRVGVLWADGHADAALGVVIVVAAPDLSAEINLQREIPHELTHILLYRAAGENYRRVPAWLNEGLAMLNQAQPEPDFPAVLAAARDGDGFLSFDSLCGGFPSEAERARLAYAQSEAFTRFLRGRYGSEGLHALVDAYAGGAACAEGAAQALGTPLAALEQAWLAEATGAVAAATRWRLLAPWLVVGSLVALGPLVFFLLILRRRGTT